MAIFWVETDLPRPIVHLPTVIVGRADAIIDNPREFVPIGRIATTIVYTSLIGEYRTIHLVSVPIDKRCRTASRLLSLRNVHTTEEPRRLCGAGRAHDSGDHQWSGRITKQGRRDLRYAMVQATHNAVDHPKWRKGPEQLEPRLGRSKAMVAIGRKLLVVV